MTARIYVQIPAYRDTELLPTLSHLLATAADPRRLRVAVAWQYSPDEERWEQELARLGVDLVKIPAASSRGCNWARELLQRRWAGEEYTLLLDSHHRFVPGWDDLLVALHRGLRDEGVDRPVLTGYLPPYDPARDPHGRVHAVYRMALAERVDGLQYRLSGHAVPAAALGAPLPTGYASLHLLFASGAFNEDVRCDPEVYFFADEVAVGLRAHSHGYDLFHPHVLLGWHLYDRRRRGKHWADHPEAADQQARSLARLRALYAGHDRGPYGVGTARTVADHEALTGIPLIDHRETPILLGG